MSIQDYLFSVVISEASELVTNTNLPFLEISERLGFSDQFYFSRRFKQKYGLSPREYRNKTRIY
ncbi:MAG: helix-turn-helix transcriptional regulator [Clostridia bacterium]|nr:helix-turn-helix transcriptional regulator [Clostridia bacterium]